jgi:hypothetical protein
MPPSGIKVNNGDFLESSDGPDHSPQNSITSINSISSLLKEKLAVSTYTSNRVWHVLIMNGLLDKLIVSFVGIAS